MKRLLALLPLLFAMTGVAAQEVLRVDFRERPPEMRAVDGLPSGPLISVLETAAQRLGVRLHWRQVPFLRSLDDLRSGRVDLVPRVLLTEQRRAYIHYLPSIGSQRLNVRFIVRPGREAELARYPTCTSRTWGSNAAPPISSRSTATTDSVASTPATTRSSRRCSAPAAWTPWPFSTRRPSRRSSPR
ncbi:transporter substrate-binding domain-containing protein [Pseudomonas sp. PL-6]